MVLACLAGMLFYRPGVEQRAMQTGPGGAESLPNVILIIVDTLRADHMSCYGYGRLTSPSLDQLAAKGVLFENAISPSSWILPSTHQCSLVVPKSAPGRGGSGTNLGGCSDNARGTKAERL